MTEQREDRRVSRRTIARGAAWTVPAIAVAVPAVAAAASGKTPPPPKFNFAGGCATVGNGAGGCNGAQKTPQVPFFIHNTTVQTLQFQIMGTKFWTANDSEPGSFNGNNQIWTNNGQESSCSPQVSTTGCSGYVSVTLAPDQCLNLWVVAGTPLGNSSAFFAKIQYRWVTPATTPPQPAGCEIVVNATIAASDGIIPSNNCDGSVVTREVCS